MEHPESFETEQQAHAFAEAAGLEHYKIEPCKRTHGMKVADAWNETGGADAWNESFDPRVHTR